MTRPTLASLDERLRAVEAVMAQTWTPEDPEARVRTLHAHLWAELAEADQPGPPTVTPRRCIEIWAANGRFIAAPTAETYLTQMTGIGLAAYLGTTTDAGRTIREWGLLTPR